MTESALMRFIMLAVSKTGARLFRNNVGRGWVGNATKSPFTDSIIIQSYRPLHAGLCDGSSDLIGWTKDGRFLAVEVKTAKGYVSDAQQNFIDQVNAAGGLGLICRSVDDVLKALKSDLGNL